MANSKTTSGSIKLLCPYTVLKNSFSVATLRIDDWVAEQFYTCREVFHDDFPRYSNILISTPQYKFKRVFQLFQNMESWLDIDKKSEIFLTQRKNIIFIKLSKFWNTSIRYSLLTLLIRSGLKIKHEITLSTLIEKNRYLRHSKNSLMLFFSGYVGYKGKNKSWYKQFKNLSEKDCLKFLLKK